MYQTVVVEREGPLAVVTLNRPEAMNALNGQLRQDIIAAINALNAEDDVRALVMTGEGERSFCAGIDIKEAQGVEVAEIEAWFGEMCNVYQAIRMLHKPLITAINGVAAGGGFQIALASDIRVGHAGSRMGQPEINVGIPSIMGSFWMSLHLGLSLNKELSLTGRLMDGEECHRVGLLNHLVKQDQVMAKAREVARELAAKPPVAMRRTKQRFREITQPAFDEAFQAGVLGQQECYKLGEPQKIMKEFAEKKSRNSG